MRTAAILLLVGLSGCNQLQTTSDKPSQAVVNQIEDRLRAIKCVAPLSKWGRSYWYSRDRAGRIDHNSVEIDLREAGFEEFKRGRYIFAAPPIRRFNTDDRDYKIAFGSFDVSKKHINMQACGPNIG